MSATMRSAVKAVARGGLGTAGIVLHGFGWMLLLTRLRWLVGLGLVSLVGWQGWRLAAPVPPAYSDTQVDLTRELRGEVAQWFRGLRLPPGKTLVGNLQRDEFGVVSEPLRDAAWRSGGFEVLPPTLGDRLRAKAGWPVKPCGGMSQLIAVARSRGADYAVGGEVLRFADLPDERLLRTRLYVWNVSEGRLVDRQEFAVGTPSPAAVNHPAAAATPYFGPPLPVTYRLFFWLVLAGLLPFVVLAHPKALLADAGIPAVFALLVLLTGVGALGLHWIVGRGMEPFWAGFWLLALVPAQALYNFKVLAFLRDNGI